MRVQEVISENNKKRYMLLDEEGRPEVAVLKYLKYLDAVQKSYNTQKTYCSQRQQHYYSFLSVQQNKQLILSR